MDTHTIKTQDTTLTIRQLLEATRQGHPTTATLKQIIPHLPNPTLAPIPLILKNQHV